MESSTGDASPSLLSNAVPTTTVDVRDNFSDSSHPVGSPHLDIPPPMVSAFPVPSLAQEFGNFPIRQSPPEPDHWHPEITAKVMNSLALAYSGCLIHKFKQLPIETVDRITLTWAATWQHFRQELEQQQTKLPVLQALDITAHYFQQFWLESWLQIADLQSTLPSNPTENSNKTA